MALSPLVKNTGLAFVAGAVTSFASFMLVNQSNPGYKAAVAAGSAALYAGARAAVGYFKAQVGGPFHVDTEA